MITELYGFEVLDSRGRPTVKAVCRLADGSLGEASVPSGASTGKAEAVELRDNDPTRYGGLGCRKAVANIEKQIAPQMINLQFDSQETFDQKLISIDGTPNKSNIGGNAILACSLAFARAKATQAKKPLYEYFADLLGNKKMELPRPTINLFSGGKHAGGQVPVQDTLIIPISATTMDQAMADVYKVYQSAVKLIKEKYGMRSLTADEGGLAPDFEDVDQMFSDAVEAIELAGFVPGKDIALAIDVASSHFYEGEKYNLGNKLVDGKGMIEVIKSWVAKYPIISVEDGLAEDDWEHWPLLYEAIADKALVLGDDLLCTQTERVDRAISNSAANALLLKVNQCGTLSEAKEAFIAAKKVDWKVTVSARSGETEDNWLADLALGWNGDQIKIGSITQSERLAKYNRLLEIEAKEGFPLNRWPEK